ncbi:MAG: PilT protein [Rhizobium sp.]|nr:PilT protein [Rhizobium sp.]
MKGSIYLDTNILVALYEGRLGVHGALWEFMNVAIEEKNITFHTSAMSFSELLVKPYRDRDEPLTRHYLQLAKSEDWLIVEAVTPIVIETSAAIRATSRLRLPDSFHLATAMSSECNYFLTFDLGINSMSDLQHPISGKPAGRPVEVVRPDAASLFELSKALS